jgi:hypothetical protein
MSLIKYILTRVLAVIILIALSNIVYKYTFWKDDINKHCDILENLWAVDSKDEAIYFGESSNFHKAENDTSRHRISYILDNIIPEINIGTVDNSGLHAGIFLSVIKNINKNSSLKLLIVTLNLRSFGANWRYATGENYLSKTELMLSNYPSIVSKFLVSLQSYDFKTDQERHIEMKQAWETEVFNIPNFVYNNVNNWDSAMAWYEWVDINPYLSEEKIPLACHYIKNFAFKIDTLSNARILDFDEIMKIANKRKYNVIFNLLSENMNEAKNLAGDELIYLMEHNRKLLIDRYTNKGAIVVDNLYSVPDSCFVDRNWPTEHYSRYGKEIIANNIKRAIKDNYLIDTIYNKK